MIFVRRTYDRRSFSERASRAPQVIDLAPGEWEEVATDGNRCGADQAAERQQPRAIASVWIIAILLLAAIAAAPVLEAATHHTT